MMRELLIAEFVDEVTDHFKNKEINMKTKSLLVGCFVLLTIFVTACAGQTATAQPGANTAFPQPASVSDRASLVNALSSAGATVEQGDPVEQDFFSVPGQIIKVNGADVQVFEYETAKAMEADASQVAEDGGSIGTNMVTWMGTPHFYKAGRILALYVGDDQAILDLLQSALGAQFAGG
jgi:hypothetical protein